jgi:cytochrome d ubiquinol oxidase subunit II
VLKTEGELAARARRLFTLVWWGVVAITIGVTAATFYVQPHVPERLASEPWGTIFPLLALAGLAGMRWLSAKGEDTKAFFASCAYIVGMLTSVVFGVYPYVLPSNNNPAASLDIYNSAAGAYGLRVGLIWFVPGMLLTTAYFFFVYRKFAGKVRLSNEGH